MKIEKLDKVDIMILRVLQADSHLTTKQLAEKVGLSTTPVFERVRKLEKDGYIKKYVAVLDMEKINYGFVVYCNVKLTKINNSVANAFTDAIAKIPQVTECYNISGEFDYMLKIHASDMKDYQNFVLNVLGKQESISGIQSTFVMETVKQDIGFQLPEDF